MQPTNHTVIITNRYGNRITATVVHVKDLGGGRAEVRVETKYHIEEGCDHPALYTTPGHEAKGTYRISGKTFTESMTHIYHGVFVRAVSAAP